MEQYNYELKTTVENQPGVLARMTIMLRKFNINIKSMEIVEPEGDKSIYEIHMVIESPKEDVSVVLKKLERLVPVILVEYKRID